MWDRVKGVKVKQVVSFLLVYEMMDFIIQDTGVGVDAFTTFNSSQQGFYNDLVAWSLRLGVALSGNWAAIGLWGDAAPCSKKDSLFLLVWHFLCGDHSRNRVYFCAFTKQTLCRCGCQGRCTFDDIFTVLVWCMQVLLIGVHPEKDHLDRPLVDTDPVRAAKAGTPLLCRAAALRKFGDWAWNKQVLGLQGWKAEKLTQRICWCCNATIGDICYCYDFSEFSQWRREPLNMPAYWARAAFTAMYVSKLFAIPGFELSMVRPDWMHCGCLGVVLYLQGHIYWELFVSLGGVWSNTSKARNACMLIMGMMRAMATHLGVESPIDDLTVTMIKAEKSSPRLKVKAAEARRLLPITLAILRNCLPCVNDHELTRARCVSALVDAYAEMYKWVEKGVSTRRVAHLGRVFLLNYCELCKSDPTGTYDAYELYPKFHLFAHVTEIKGVCLD